MHLSRKSAAKLAALFCLARAGSLVHPRKLQTAAYPPRENLIESTRYFFYRMVAASNCGHRQNVQGRTIE